MVKFPKDFLWGAATSAYQIEGATSVDGRGTSIWDDFCRVPGKIEDGSNGNVACAHYHRWEQDIALMRSLGLGGYRFSIAWPRVLPYGCGETNTRGLDFYDRLVDGLLGLGIEPFATLYHWDLPSELQARGGWAHRDTAYLFADYAERVSRRLGDRVSNWITHNEPWCAAILGHQRGIHAPGFEDFPQALQVSHHLLLSHGLAVPAIRSAGGPTTAVGIALNLVPAVAASASAADADACRHFDGAFNRWFLDPLHGREYPADIVSDYQRLGGLPAGGLRIEPDDFRQIATPTDFLGVNYYMRSIVRSDTISEDANEPRTVFQAPESESTDMGWEVYPDGLQAILERVHADYAPSRLYVTENGASFGDRPTDSNRIADRRRIAFLRDHLLAARRAIDAGVPLKGFFAWSLLDNFEWERGYTQRFGIVWVDYATGARHIKDSGLWYRDVIARGGVRL